MRICIQNYQSAGLFVDTQIILWWRLMVHFYELLLIHGGKRRVEMRGPKVMGNNQIMCHHIGIHLHPQGKLLVIFIFCKILANWIGRKNDRRNRQNVDESSNDHYKVLPSAIKSLINNLRKVWKQIIYPFLLK